MEPLDEKVEDYVWIIDNILENNLDEHDFKKCKHLDYILAQRLYDKGHTEGVYNDEFLGPRLTETSEKALMKIVQDRIPYHGKFQIISENRNGTIYFRPMEVHKIGKEVKYKDIAEDIVDKPEDILHIDSDTLRRLEYQN